ncbi:hypothetical protein ICW40_01115 [Actinotalea ferrariae]|uniref:hypothetical protein n=1 Tax=Actinotalea ferrariae TaxID=1386098 RepID=UPI001C8B6E2C|nr:hypothetical protein [Actinotalea ferrariae]MBX9243405.1 hypothetical protein [Actinotalea ferrariae]
MGLLTDKSVSKVLRGPGPAGFVHHATRSIVRGRYGVGRRRTLVFASTGAKTVRM